MDCRRREPIVGSFSMAPINARGHRLPPTNGWSAGLPTSLPFFGLPLALPFSQSPQPGKDGVPSARRDPRCDFRLRAVAWPQDSKPSAPCKPCRLLPVTVWVLRGGQPHQISHFEVVPGDVLLLEQGEQVPADARLIEVSQMRVDNSALTGEARSQRRTAEPVSGANPLEAPNLVFAGTAVLTGRGRAVVFATGMKTEFGQIAAMATRVEPALSPLQKRSCPSHGSSRSVVPHGGCLSSLVSDRDGFWVTISRSASLWGTSQKGFSDRDAGPGHGRSADGS